jgi:hypothetical protein
MKFTIVFLSALVASKPLSSGLTHSFTDPDHDITLSWGFPTNETIKFRLTTPGEFYAGLGFGPTGEKADMVVGWVENNKPVVKDFYEAHGSQAPELDSDLGGTSDLFDIEASDKDWKLSIGFTRKLNTGDPIFDKKLNLSEKQDFVWAFCATDYGCIADGPGDTMAFHGMEGRGHILGLDLLSDEHKIQ